MKQIFVNFKRFDVPAAYGGVAGCGDPARWAEWALAPLCSAISRYDPDEVRFTFFVPEAHLIPAVQIAAQCPALRIGCQGLHREDVAPGGNFGAFTALRPAAAAKALGCTAALIGHCEERRDKAGILAEACAEDDGAVSRILRSEIAAAKGRDLSVLFCVGETAEQRPRWRETLRAQLEIGLAGQEREGVTVAYEPVWAIGPGKTPPSREEIREVAQFVKAETGGMALVYGGGLKADNAEMLASIDEVDGGLIALTRFAGDIGFYPEEYLEIVKLYLGY